MHPTTVLLMLGVLLSGYSSYLSFTYLTKVLLVLLLLAE